MTIARRLAFNLATRLNPRANVLTSLANLYGTDKGTGRRGHQYTRIYSELLEPLRDRPIRLLEIGLLGMRRGGWDDKLLRDKGETHGRDAPSLKMWSEYFPRAEIFGLDFNDFTGVKIDRCKIFRADASSADELRAVWNEIGGELDVIIDDASHASDHQQITLGALFPAVKPGGVFIIEDLFFQPADREPADAIKTVDVLRRAEVTGEFRGSHLTPEASAYLEQNVERVALFDSLVRKGPIRHRDSLGVLWKKA
jgi:hypothetical protein